MSPVALALIRILEFKLAVIRKSAPLCGDHRHTKQSGMSLLEVLVVLVILGLTVVVTGPPMFKILESVAFKTETDDLARQISSLRVAALLEKRTLTLEAQALATYGNANDVEGVSGKIGQQITPVNENLTRSETENLRSVSLPEGWILEGDDIVFLKTGVCLGGTIILKAPSGRAKTLAFRAPECEMNGAGIR